MPDFRLVPGAQLTPGHCATCFRDGGEMVDTLAEFPAPGGRIYLCLTCVDEANRLRGGLDPAQALEREQLIQDLQATVADLEGALTVERDNKVVSVTELQEMWAAKPQVAVLVDEHDPEPVGRRGMRRGR